MIFDLFFKGKQAVGEKIYCSTYIDYQCIDTNFFIKWKKEWIREVGINDGDKLCLYIENNKHMMPIILSLEHVICELHFMNKSIEANLFDLNLLKCNYLITDQYIEHVNLTLVHKLNFYDTVLNIYQTPMINRVESSEKKYIYYTSGSTGKPKAFVKTEVAIYKEGFSIMKELGLKNTDRILSIVPCNHVFGQSVCCIAAALAGVKVTYVNALSSVANIIKHIKEEKYNYIVVSPVYLDFLCEFSNILHDNCRCVSGGAPLSEKVRKSNLQVINFYGTTETGVVAINRGENSQYYAGRLVEGVEVIHKDIVETYNSEEMYSFAINTPYMAKAFGEIGEKVQKISDLIQTSDYGLVKGKDLYLFGRLDNIININGLKVSTAEIEGELLRHEAIKEVKVVREQIAGREFAHAYVVEKEKGTLTVSALLEFCVNNMTHYKIPKRIDIIDKLQCSELGKITKNQMRIGSTKL